MKTRSFWTLIAGVFSGAMILLQAGDALADERTEARRHFRHGMELVVAGQLDEGIAELEVAYNILPHPNVLYNIGRAYAEAGHYEEAIDFFDRYLASAPPDMNEVRGFVAALRERLDARAAAQAATATTAAARPDPTTTAAATTASSGTSVEATRAEIASLLDTAARLESLGAALGSDELAGRAAALRSLAGNLEASLNDTIAHAVIDPNTVTTDPNVIVPDPNAVATDPNATATTEPDGTDGTDGTAAEGTDASGIALGGNTDDLYEERFVSSTRSAVNPLDAPNSTTIITRQDIRLTGHTAIGELLRRVAGVQVMTTGPSETNVGMRGFNQRLSPRVLLLVNGRSTYVDLLGITLWQQQPLSVEDIERIEVVRGPASALYGANGFSGIVNIITRTPGAEPSTEASVNIGNAGQVRGYFGTDGRVGRLSYRFSAAYDSSNRFSVPLDANRVDAHVPAQGGTDIAQRSVRAFGHLTYRLNHGAELSAEVGTNYLNPAVIAGTGVFSNIYVYGESSHASAALTTGWGGIRFFWNGLNIAGDQFGDAPFPIFARTNTYDLEGTFAHVFHTGSVAHDIVAGAGYRRKYANWNLFETAHTEDHFQGFAQDSIRLSNRVTLIAGARVDKHPLIPRPIFSPRAALVVRVGDRQAIRTSVSTAFRTFSFLESYLTTLTPTPVTAVQAFGGGSQFNNTRFNSAILSPESILSAEIGYQNQESDRFSLDIAAYANRVRNIISLSTSTPAYTLADNANPRLADITGFNTTSNAFLYGHAGFANEPGQFYVGGLEVVARVYPADGLDIWANYSLNIAYSDVGGNFIRENRAPMHQFNGGVQYRGDVSDSVGFDLAIDFHAQSSTVWPEQVVGATAVEVQNFNLQSQYMINGRIGVRLMDDKLSLGVIGYNVNGLWNTGVRQHPFAQQLDARVLGNVSYRF